MGHSPDEACGWAGWLPSSTKHGLRQQERRLAPDFMAAKGWDLGAVPHADGGSWGLTSLLMPWEETPKLAYLLAQRWAEGKKQGEA